MELRHLKPSRLIHTIAKQFHVEIANHTEANKRLAEQFKNHYVNLVFDVGSFLGEYAINLIKTGYKGDNSFF